MYSVDVGLGLRELRADKRAVRNLSERRPLPGGHLAKPSSRDGLVSCLWCGAGKKQRSATTSDGQSNTVLNVGSMWGGP